MLRLSKDSRYSSKFWKICSEHDFLGTKSLALLQILHLLESIPDSEGIVDGALIVVSGKEGCAQALLKNRSLACSALSSTMICWRWPPEQFQAPSGDLWETQILLTAPRSNLLTVLLLVRHSWRLHRSCYGFQLQTSFKLLIPRPLILALIHQDQNMAVWSW